MPWAALCPFSGRFLSQIPHAPPGTMSLVPFSLWLHRQVGHPQGANASPLCMPPSRGEWHPHLPAAPAVTVLGRERQSKSLWGRCCEEGQLSLSIRDSPVACFLLGQEQKQVAAPRSPHCSMAWHQCCSQHVWWVSGFSMCGGDGGRYHGEGSIRDHQRKLWRHWESSYRNLRPQHPTLLPLLSSQN